ncbi:hypothetical protein SLH46_20675 [Draconibacterium sp. IB214405]|uniref:hypothetical protein n=1 Tax=Draconibacterium sp. IB214405 TaxID=3097352 RepID=UPI002A0E78DD|nr:hypothetical protein [Draconibacterium sp. IB214405]MDX8341626.1 hypothetical protein [Draconibacterium sp. IB214405]
MINFSIDTKRILFLVGLFILFGCNKNEELVGFYLDRGFEFTLLNNKNEDLLSSETTGAINEEDIRLFYSVEGELQPVYNANFDYPRNFLIYEDGGMNRIRIFMNSSDTEEKPITIIDWGNNDTDTVAVEFTYTSTMTAKRKVWVNNELIWDYQDDEFPLITLHKDY